MKRILISAFILVSLLSACIIAPPGGWRGHGGGDGSKDRGGGDHQRSSGGRGDKH